MEKAPGAGQAQQGGGRQPPVYDPNNGGHFGMLLGFRARMSQMMPFGCLLAIAQLTLFFDRKLLID